MSSFRTTELSDPPYESDGLRFITVKTPNLKGRGDICVYVPEVEKDVTNLPIYILLHGVYGSAWIWALKGGAHRTARRLMTAGTIRPAIIAMPSDGLWGDGSGYLPHHERDFARWIVEDVPAAVRELIPQAAENAAVCLGGLSMGGYGALRLGGLHPERFRAISGHSSITKLEQMTEFVEEPLVGYGDGDGLPNVIDALTANRERLPALRFDCGRADTLFAANNELHAGLERLGIDHTYEVFDGGHEWPYWQEHVEQTLRFFDQSV